MYYLNYQVWTSQGWQARYTIADTLVEIEEIKKSITASNEYDEIKDFNITAPISIENDYRQKFEELYNHFLIISGIRRDPNQTIKEL